MKLRQLVSVLRTSNRHTEPRQAMAEPRRYLCSHLVSLTVNGEEAQANLEEIWPEGALLECELAAAEQAHAEMRCDGVLFAGRITSSVEHEFGWRVEMEFSPLTPWSLACFQPEHLLAI